MLYSVAWLGVTYMTDRCRPRTCQEDFLPFNEADDTVILELMAESTTHLPSEEGVMLETFEKIITGMTLSDEASNLRCDLSQFNALRSMMGRAEEDQTGGAGADGCVFRVFLGV